MISCTQTSMMIVSDEAAPLGTSPTDVVRSGSRGPEEEPWRADRAGASSFRDAMNLEACQQECWRCPWAVSPSAAGGCEGAVLQCAHPVSLV